MKKVKFDLEKAKAGAKLVTRYGNPARIICFDYRGKNAPIVALIDEGKNEEFAAVYSLDGKRPGNFPDYDLFILEESTFIPYAKAGEVLNDMMKHGPMVRSKNGEHYCAIVQMNDRGVQIGSEYCYSFEQLKNLYTWQNGHPCGVEDGDQ